ncbi:hypothetical protein GF314_09655, partial [bacterium]|nr:hypothetical protein [bacterium]
LEPATRVTNHAEVDTGFTDEQAVEEATRCLSCGCQDVFECKLKKYMDDYQVDPRRYAGATHDEPADESHPDIRRDPNKCVKCGKCVEVCDQGRGLAVLGFTQRGFEAGVGPVLNKPMVETHCEACGDCIAVCPVGALTEKTPLDKPGPYNTVPADSSCAACSLGCDIGVHALADKVIRVTPLADGWNEVHMCRKGRFEWSDANADQPEVDTTAAVAQLAEKLAGGQIVLAPDCTNEEAVIARAVAGKLGGRVAWLADPEQVANQQAALAAAPDTVTVRDLREVPAAVVIGCDLGTDFPVAGVELRRAINHGGDVNFVDCRDHRAGTLRELGRDERDEILAVLRKDDAVLVVGPEAGDVTDLVHASGCKVLLLRAGTNAAGMVGLGLEPVTAAALADGTPTLLLGEPPADLTRPQAFFAAQSVARNAKVDADLVLPRTHYLDDQGTFMATDGRLCLLTPARERRPNWELLRDLADAVGAEVDLDTVLADAKAV